MSDDGWTWDAATTLDALGAAEVALWSWEPEADRLRVSGHARALGLGPLAPECASAALRALALPQDRSLAEEMLRPQPPGAGIAVRLRLSGAGVRLWRGVWLSDGRRAAGVVAPETSFAAAEEDELTGLLTRKSFVARARERLQGEGAHQLLVADLDRLRRLNEALGHERADLALATLGSRLRAAFPPEALLGRTGEDEFAALCPLAVSPGEQGLRRALEQPMRIAGCEVHPTLSVGAAEACGGSGTTEAGELMRRAALAVEAAKRGGRGGAAAYARGLERGGLSRLALEGELKPALEHGQLAPFYQPIVRLATGELVGFEALVRWRHPRRGLLRPEQFLPACAELGLLGELGAMMRRKAALQLSAWRARHARAGDLTVSVNLTMGELERRDLLAETAAIRQEADLPAGALKLEVTEGEVMRDPERVTVVLRRLRAAGVGLALDDFGTGFSSLSYLTRLPVDILKIDAYFVRTLGQDPGSAKIVSSIARLGRELAMEVIAEGVEDAAAARQLRELGCDYGQGFGFAPALSAEAAEAYIGQGVVERRYG